MILKNLTRNEEAPFPMVFRVNEEAKHEFLEYMINNEIEYDRLPMKNWNVEDEYEFIIE